ncbi:MAG: D-alanyl-D-alanine carboxypeptidase [Candidatus Terrybacteria bacterium]|nr:D-alanyl-D-alanine carboxypeptidase [Candidatus Terrybacteria bacterium]
MENKKIIRLVLMIIAVIGLLILVFYPRISETGLSGFSLFPEHKGPVVSNPFENLNLEAKAVYVFDLARNEPIFELNSRAQLPLASLTKIMTVLVAKEISFQGESLDNIIDSALAQSSNEAASALASMDNNFINLMNKKAKELNLRQTYFLNETGLDISRQISGGYGSAQDVAKLIKYAIKNNPELFEATTNGESNSNIYASSTTLLIASKTGFTDLAGGNLAVIFDAGFEHPIAVVVLGSTKEGRFTDVEKLIKATFKNLELRIKN